MKNPIVLFGLSAGAALVVINFVSEYFVAPVPENYAIAEKLGYAGILLSMSLIFFGVRRYRETELGGRISFWKALAAGVASDFIASVIYGAFMIYYFTTYRPDFMVQYMDHYREQIRASGESAEAIAAELAALDAHAEMLMNPYFNSALMFVTVFLVGLLVALVAAAVLRRPEGG